MSGVCAEAVNIHYEGVGSCDLVPSPRPTRTHSSPTHPACTHRCTQCACNHWCTLPACLPGAEDALMDRDLVHRQTAASVVQHMSLGVAGWCSA